MEDEDEDILLEQKFLIQPTNFDQSDEDEENLYSFSLQSQQSDKSTNDDDDDDFTVEDSDEEALASLKSFRRKIFKTNDVDFKLNNNALNHTFPRYKSELVDVTINDFTDSLASKSCYAPSYRNHQLIGDSQLLRFAEQLLNYRRNIIRTESKYSGIGYCVSGQKISDLKQLLLKKQFEICDKVILLIGTNDLLHKVPLNLMCKNFESILNILKENTVQRIVILTVPPVPKLCKNRLHMSDVKYFNEFITGHAEGDKIVILDLASLFISYDNKVSLNYFEKTFKFTDRPDLIHMNLDGFKMLQSLLNVSYFDKNF